MKISLRKCVPLGIYGKNRIFFDTEYSRFYRRKNKVNPIQTTGAIFTLLSFYFYRFLKNIGEIDLNDRMSYLLIGVTVALLIAIISYIFEFLIKTEVVEFQFYQEEFEAFAREQQRSFKIAYLFLFMILLLSLLADIFFLYSGTVLSLAVGCLLSLSLISSLFSKIFQRIRILKELYAELQ